MKHCSTLYVFLLLLFFIGLKPTQAQQSNINYLVSLGTGFSSDTTLPFWMVSNRYGNVPNSNYGLLNAAVFADLKKPEKNFGIAYKLSATGYLANENALLINEMYLRLQYKNWALDLGNMNDAVKWEGLSSTNGNIVKSINSRAYPGINLRTLEDTKLPFAKKWLSFQFNFANYWLNDDRYVDDAMLHHASLFFKFKLSEKTDFITGIDHYAQWGGTSPTTSKQPDSFKDFIRIVFGQSGGAESLVTDQMNALGNHLGSYLLQLNYRGNATNLYFYFSHLFEDASGMEMQNWMDGLYGVMVDLKQPKAPISHVLAEFTYTKNMSGENPPDQGYDENGNKIHGRGLDNYFNNGIYGSGWTYFGKTIGTPYIMPVPADSDGITNGVIIGDNRLMAFNIGIKGYLRPMQYSVLLSHVTRFGWFENEYEPKPQQFSGLFEVLIPQNTHHMPFDMKLSAAFDTGSYLPPNFGAFLTLTRRGSF